MKDVTAIFVWGFSQFVELFGSKEVKWDHFRLSLGVAFKSREPPKFIEGEPKPAAGLTGSRWSGLGVLGAVVKIPLALELDLEGVIRAFGVAGKDANEPGPVDRPIMFM